MGVGRFDSQDLVGRVFCVQRDPLAYLPCLPKCVAILDRLVTVEVPEDNTLRLNLLLVRCPPPPSLGALLP
jgi:hypothetical protein